MESETRRKRRSYRRRFSFDHFPSGATRYVSAAFGDLDDVQRAVQALEAAGCPPSEISVHLTDETRKHRLRTHPEFEGLDPDSYVVDLVELNRNSKALKGAGAGATIGATVGAIAGAVGAVGTYVIVPSPGIVVTGPVVAALTGVGALGAIGGLLGGLLGAGRSEYRAKHLEQILREGRIVLITKARTEADMRRIARTLTAAGGFVSQLAST